jgi:hypothetical protein
MLWDRGRHFGDGLEWSDSPAAIAYEVTEVPTTFVLDRERRVARVLPGEAFLTQLEAAVAEVVQTR